MGSKNLKMVAARGTMDIKIAHPMEALEFDKRYIELITERKGEPDHGYAGHALYLGRNKLLGRRKDKQLPVQPASVLR